MAIPRCGEELEFAQLLRRSLDILKRLSIVFEQGVRRRAGSHATWGSRNPGVRVGQSGKEAAHAD